MKEKSGGKKPQALKQAKKTAKKTPKSPKRPESAVVREDPAEYGKATPRFIDLFCGIGGFRIAFEKTGARCVFSSDHDKFSQATYEANFGERPHGDIHSVAVADIPAHDILCAGCQPFSIYRTLTEALAYFSTSQSLAA